MGQLPVHDGGEAALAVVVLALGKLGEIEEALSAPDIAVVGADTEGARVEVEVTMDVE